MSSAVRTYLDHAATTPMVPAAVEAVTRELGRIGNPSSIHASGRYARRAVEDARESIAAHLGAHPTEVIFTSGGTEADNLAVKGAWARRGPGRSAVVCSAIEHHAVLDSVTWLAGLGAQTALAAVDHMGRIDLDELRTLVGGHTALVSVMWGNNEVGTLQPVREVAALANGAGAVSHSDAVQAVGHVAVDFAASGLDLLSVAAHKLGGPRGVGALLARRTLALEPILHGGGQERNVRSGTLDVAGIAGFAAAVEAAVTLRAAEEERLRRMRADLAETIRRLVPDAVVNTPDEDAALPGILNVTFPGCEADAMLMLLDSAGVDCASGSACSAGVLGASHVLLAMGRSHREARSSLRFSLGHSTTSADLDALAAVLPDAVDRARQAGATDLGRDRVAV